MASSFIELLVALFLAEIGALTTLFSACGGGDSPTTPSGNTAMLGTVAAQFANNRVQSNVAGSALNDVGGAALVQSTAGVFLVSRQASNSFVAVDAVCTHEGCTINGADDSTYVCPCHGSRYNRNGQVVQGPARSSLRQYSATFTDGVVTIAL